MEKFLHRLEKLAASPATSFSMEKFLHRLEKLAASPATMQDCKLRKTVNTLLAPEQRSACDTITVPATVRSSVLELCNGSSGVPSSLGVYLLPRRRQALCSLSFLFVLLHGQ